MTDFYSERRNEVSIWAINFVDVGYDFNINVNNFLYLQ